MSSRLVGVGEWHPKACSNRLVPLDKQLPDGDVPDGLLVVCPGADAPNPGLVWNKVMFSK